MDSIIKTSVGAYNLNIVKKTKQKRNCYPGTLENIYFPHGMKVERNFANDFFFNCQLSQ